MIRALRRWAVRGALLAVATPVLLVAAFAFVPPPTTAFMLRAAAAGATVDYHWTPAGEIAPAMLLAAVAAEDQRFADHWGFDFEAIEKAAAHNSRGGSVRGASTISQQVAKNLFLWPGRSWLRKGLEVALTATIEAAWPKRRILEVYVNVAEMGRGVYGVGAASRRFFHKSPARLEPDEAALLAAVLPNPSAYRADAPSPLLRKRQHWILGQMRALGGTSWLRRLSASTTGSAPP